MFIFFSLLLLYLQIKSSEFDDKYYKKNKSENEYDIQGTYTNLHDYNYHMYEPQYSFIDMLFNDESTLEENQYYSSHNQNNVWDENGYLTYGQSENTYKTNQGENLTYFMGTTDQEIIYKTQIDTPIMSSNVDQSSVQNIYESQENNSFATHLFSNEVISGNSTDNQTNEGSTYEELKNIPIERLIDINNKEIISSLSYMAFSNSYIEEKTATDLGRNTPIEHIGMAVENNCQKLNTSDTSNISDQRYNEIPRISDINTAQIIDDSYSSDYYFIKPTHTAQDTGLVHSEIFGKCEINAVDRYDKDMHNLQNINPESYLLGKIKIHQGDIFGKNDVTINRFQNNTKEPSESEVDRILKIFYCILKDQKKDIYQSLNNIKDKIIKSDMAVNNNFYFKFAFDHLDEYKFEDILSKKYFINWHLYPFKDKPRVYKYYSEVLKKFKNVPDDKIIEEYNSYLDNSFHKIKSYKSCVKYLNNVAFNNINLFNEYSDDFLSNLFAIKEINNINSLIRIGKKIMADKEEIIDLSNYLNYKKIVDFIEYYKDNELVKNLFYESFFVSELYISKINLFRISRKYLLQFRYKIEFLEKIMNNIEPFDINSNRTVFSNKGNMKLLAIRLIVITNFLESLDVHPIYILLYITQCIALYNLYKERPFDIKLEKRLKHVIFNYTRKTALIKFFSLEPLLDIKNIFECSQKIIDELSKKEIS